MGLGHGIALFITLLCLGCGGTSSSDAVAGGAGMGDAVGGIGGGGSNAGAGGAAGAGLGGERPIAGSDAGGAAGSGGMDGGAGGAAGASATRIEPCEDAACDNAVVREILDANGFTDIDVATVTKTDETGRVVELNLYPGDLFGPLPTGISVLPKVVGKLSALRTLLVGHGELSDVPDELAQLTELDWLSLIYNDRLTRFPPIFALTRLTRLDLDFNQIDEVPPWIGGLVALGSLWMPGNRVERLPTEIGSLPKLHQMNLADNSLAELPESVGDLTLMSRLFLNGNLLSAVPDRLTAIDPGELAIGDNNLCNVSPALRDWLDEHDPDWAESQYSDSDRQVACVVAVGAAAGD